MFASKGKTVPEIIINEHKFAGNLCRELPKIDTFIETSIAQKRPIPVSVLREETFSKYPYWATRELLMNALMHRDYETNAPVQFYEYDDRIEVQNPGGLYGKVTPDNFPNVSDYRNPFVAEAMKVLGYVNRFSRGVYWGQKKLVENGNDKAVFDFSLVTAFRVVENVSEKYFEEGFGEDATQENENTTQTLPKHYPRKIIKFNCKQSRSRKELAKLLGITSDDVKYHIQKLADEGIIKREGSDRAGKWVIINNEKS